MGKRYGDAGEAMGKPQQYRDAMPPVKSARQPLTDQRIEVDSNRSAKILLAISTIELSLAVTNAFPEYAAP